MKAVRIHEHGGADKLRYEEAEDPVLRSPRDVIVRLRAASLNHIDLWNRKGLTGMKVEFPHILGADGAGVVEEVGNEVTHCKKGDAVCLYPPVGVRRLRVLPHRPGLHVRPPARPRRWA